MEMPAMEMERPLFWPQFKILMWKNWQIKKNFLFKTFLEILLPLIMVTLLILMGVSKKDQSFNETQIQDVGTFFNQKAEWPRLLYVAPNNSDVRTTMERVLRKLNESNVNISGCMFFDSSTEIDKTFMSSSDDKDIAVVFSGDQPGISSNFTLRFTSSKVPSTITNMVGLDVCRDPNLLVNCLAVQYFSSGFSFLQSLISSTLLQGSPSFVWKPSMSLYPIPAANISSPDFQQWGPVLLTISFAYLINIILLDVVAEKENHIKQALLLMGTQLKAYWCATFVSHLIKILLTITIMVCLIYASKLIPLGHYFVFTCLLLAYGLSIITLAFALSTFFNKAQAAGTVGFMVTMILSLLYLPAKYLVDKVPSVVFYLFSLLPPTGFCLSVQNMFTAGAQPSSFYSPVVGLAILIFDIFLYGFLAFYLDHVIPGEYGAKESPCFLFQKSFWSKHSSSISGSVAGSNMEASNPDIEPISEEFQNKDAVQIIALEKVFSKKDQPKVKAVNGLSLKVYEGQITALLGHNGAGKSTLIHMLTGVLPSTSGKICIYGCSPTSNLEDLRQLLGVCLQDNVFHPSLSPYQHLHIFAGIKNVSLTPEKMKEILEELNLYEVRDIPTDKLSGGQKRKLCVGLALVGDPKVIILDEPTTGVDVSSRHLIWDMLRKRKGDRVIMMTTHFMEEADILADRKAIISKGKLKCAGSSLFLKNRFGIGYHLNVELDPETASREVISLVRNHVPNAQVTRQNRSEVSLTLPWEQASRFPAMFGELELTQLSHGITMTTLEEVFLRLGVEEATAEEEMEDGGGQGDEANLMPKPSENLSELEQIMESTQPNFLQSTTYFLHTRFLLLSRNPLTFVRMLVSPFVYCLLAFIITYNVPSNQSPPLTLDPQLYPQPHPLLLFNNSNTSLDSLVSNLRVELEVLNNSKPSLANLPPHYLALDVEIFKPTQVKIQQLVNGSFVHAIPVLQSLLTRAAYGGQSLEVTSHPLPPSKQDLLVTSTLSSLAWVYLTVIYLVSLPVEVAVESVADRETGVRAQLRAAGLSFPGYWLPMWLSHNVLGCTAMVIMLGLSMILGLDKGLYYGAARAIAIMAVFLCNFASLLLAYCLGHVFQREATAMQWLPLMAIMPVITLTISITILTTFLNTSITILLFFLSLFFPFLAPMNILIEVSKLSAEMRMMESFGIPADQSRFFQPDGPIMILIYAVLLAVPLYFGVLWVVENLPWMFQRQHTSSISIVPPFDDDVAKEEARIQTIIDTLQPVPPVLLYNVRKEYQNFSCRKSQPRIALEHVTLGINYGNLFGLLGPNGAGKTSLIKILVTEQHQTSGQVMIGGISLSGVNRSQVFQDIGYCPQESCLIKTLTMAEHLTLFAAIRGIPPKKISSLVEKLMNHLGISGHSKKLIKNLSGGTKRKVCLALSLLGLPKLLILDEPTTGVDPQSRAFLRELLGSLYQHGGPRCLILTTHSIEDVEALCSRVAILVKGTLRCLGTTQHLKSKYGTGYTLEAKLASDTQKEDLKKQVKNLFPDATVQETQPSFLVFFIPHVSSLGPVFALLEEAKSKYGVQEYSFTQTTLEQVFLRFAKEQQNTD